MGVHACNSSSGKVEGGGSWVQSQIGLHIETLSQKTITPPKNKKVKWEAEDLAQW
jgi:hypothetical protein